MLHKTETPLKGLVTIDDAKYTVAYFLSVVWHLVDFWFYCIYSCIIPWLFTQLLSIFSHSWRCFWVGTICTVWHCGLQEFDPRFAYTSLQPALMTLCLRLYTWRTKGVQSHPFLLRRHSSDVGGQFATYAPWISVVCLLQDKAESQVEASWRPKFDLHVVSLYTLYTMSFPAVSLSTLPGI